MLRTLKPIPLAVAACLALASGQVESRPRPASTDVLRLYQHERQREDADQQQQRFRQLQRERSVAAPQSSTAVTSETACWAISGLRIGGNRRISQATIGKALQPLLSDCMDNLQINQLLKAITGLYLREGYIGSRPYLASPVQDGESLDILIVEGFVESIELSDPSLPLSLSSAFPDMLGRPLMLRDLEQGLDQLNRLRAFDLTADVEPGQLSGGSRIVIRPRSRPARWSLGATYDNHGGLQTGRNRAAISLSLDSPLQLNDYIRLAVSRTLAQGPAYSSSVGLQYSIPYGPWTLGLSASRLEYSSLLPGKQSASGESAFYALNLERSIWRDQHTLLSASTRLSRKSLESFYFNNRISLQSPTLLVAETGINLLWIGSGIWSAYLGYAQGLQGWGADTRLAEPGTPNPQFRKYLGNLGYSRQGRLQAMRWQWNSELNLQYSPDPLPAIEQQLLTDDTAVRGWRQRSAASDSAAVWRNTLSLPVELDHRLQLSPHLGLDLAWGQSATRLPAQRLAGAHAGASFGWPGGQLELDYQKSLNGTGKQPIGPEPGYWLMKLSLQF